MRVLYVHRTAGTRVEGVHIREIAKALTALGHEARIFSPPGCDPMRTMPANGSGPARPGLLRRTVGALPRVVHPFFFEIMEIAYSIAIVPVLLWRVMRFRPAFIYERASTCQFAATLAGRCFGVPLVQEVNQTLDIGRLRKVYLLPLAQALERWVCRHAKAVLTVSGRFREMLIERGYDGPKIFVIPNAADPERFSPDVEPAGEFQGRPDSALALGYVGGFLVWHKLDRFLELVSEIEGVSLLLIGDGPERSRLVEKVREMGIEGRVRFAGAVSHTELPSYIQCMDIAVMVSATEYASPVKMFEYMAMGKAIVAPRVPPIEEILDDGETAVFFDPDDFDSLKRAVRRIVEDRSLRERLGCSARALLEQRHTWEANAARIVQIATAREREKEYPHR